MVGAADAVMEEGAVGADATSPSRRGGVGGVCDDSRWMGDVFCKALSGGKGVAIEAEGEESLFRARGSESLEDVEIGFHEKWSLF